MVRTDIDDDDGDGDDDEPVPIEVHISDGLDFVPMVMEADIGAKPTTLRVSTYIRDVLQHHSPRKASQQDSQLRWVARQTLYGSHLYTSHL